MTSGSRSTFFAPAGRQDAATIRHQVNACLEHPITRTILEMMNGYVMILNENRQVLTCNPEILEALQLSCPDGIVGLRPGETFGCVHFSNGPDGCGTSPHCRSCGAVIAIMSSMDSNQPITEECRLTMKQDNRLHSAEFRVRCTPIQLSIGRAIVLVMQDISDSKRRLVLEQMFFHDILNTIGGIEGWSSFLKEAEKDVSVNEIVTLAERLKDEVYAQRTLMEADSGELELNIQPITLGDILSDLDILLRVHDATRGKNLNINHQNADTMMQTDRTILNRVLINMVKNALEATDPGGTVTVSADRSNGTVQLRVHNDGVIPDSIQPHIFERSFTTKGTGRGIGAWSMKLLGQQYLDGIVSFESSEERGTEFTLQLPLVLAPFSSDPTAGKSHPQADHPEMASRTVLIVDDNEPVLRLAGVFVEHAGARALCHSDPIEALAILQSKDMTIDAALIDIGLPAMSGVELAKRLRQHIPDLPVAFMTGYSESFQADRDHKITDCHHLPKPFRKEAVVQVLDKMMEQPGT